MVTCMLTTRYSHADSFHALHTRYIRMAAFSMMARSDTLTCVHLAFSISLVPDLRGQNLSVYRIVHDFYCPPFYLSTFIIIFYYYYYIHHIIIIETSFLFTNNLNNNNIKTLRHDVMTASLWTFSALRNKTTGWKPVKRLFTGESVCDTPP